jgi:hypothetical protein
VGSVLVLCGRLVGVEGFELDRPEHSQAGMPPFGIVPTFYPLEDGIGKFIAGSQILVSRTSSCRVPQKDSIMELS